MIKTEKKKLLLYFVIIVTNFDKFCQNRIDMSHIQTHTFTNNMDV